MSRRSSTFPKPKKRKKVTVQLIKEKHAGDTTEPYRLLAEIRSAEHGHLAEAKIALAWRLGWRSDADGHMKLGQCRKRGDLDRELDGFDFIIMLNKEAWPTLNEKQKRALIDHELCHAQIVNDTDGNPKYNDRDRLVCRIKKHDTEEFKVIVDRHGMWTQDLEAIAKAAIADSKRPLLAVAEKGVTVEAVTDAVTMAVAEAAGVDVEKPPATEPVSSTPPAKDGWRSLEIEDLGLNSSRVAKLHEVGIKTLGEFSDFAAKHGDFWYRDIRGFGETSANDVQDRFAAFWEKHPEFAA